MNEPSTADFPTSATAPDAAGPVREHDRIITLDVLRGVALFGILMVNMPFFAMPFMHIFLDPTLAEGPLSERLAFAFVKVFFEYKFISLFSLLFGIGFVVQLTRMQARGGPFVSVYLRRLGILFLIGLIHAIGLWFGDILLMYSVIGVALLLCASFSPRVLMALAALALVVGMVFGLMMGGLQYLAMAADADRIEQRYASAEEIVAEGDAPSGFAAIKEVQFDPGNPIWIDAERRAFRDGPLGDALAFRAVIYGYAVLFSVFGYGWHVLAMFLLGAALMKLNFFAAAKRHWHMRLACIALPIGLLLEAIAVAAWWHGDFEYSLATVLMTPLHEIGSVLLMLGYVGVVILIVHGGLLAWLTEAIAAAGRMALTVYLGETLLATGIMYWWGLGLFDSFNRVELIGIALLIYTALVVFSVLWLNVFRFGPLEWLWRSLTYLRVQPMR